LVADQFSDAENGAIFDMNIAWWLIEMQESNGWNDHLAFGLQNEAGFDLPDELRGIDQTLDLIEFEYGGHRHASRLKGEIMEQEGSSVLEDSEDKRTFRGQEGGMAGCERGKPAGDIMFISWFDWPTGYLYSVGIQAYY
jgi:hypothetical protein